MAWTWNLAVCFSSGGAGADSAWEQEKLEARKMPENGDQSHLSSARCVEQFLCIEMRYAFSLRSSSLQQSSSMSAAFSNASFPSLNEK